MLQSIVRFSLGILFTWLVAKGAITQDQVNSDLPTIVEFLCIALLTIGSILWTYFEKLAKGHITPTGESIPVTPVNLTVAEPSASLKPTVDAAGNVTITPSTTKPLIDLQTK